MSEVGWAKQIRSDSSIQMFLSERFLHPTIRDCVVVGNCSLRLVTVRNDQLKVVARHDETGTINSAAIVYVNEKPQVSFIVGLRKLVVAVPSIGSFAVSLVADLDKKYYHVSGGENIVCLSSFDSSLLFVDISDGHTFGVTLRDDPIPMVLFTSWVEGNLIVVQKSTNIQVRLYALIEEELRCIAKHSPNYLKPYKIVGIPHHKAAYILGDGGFLCVRKSDTGGWLFDYFEVPMKYSDPLLVDAAPIGVQLALLTAGGSIIKFDGTQYELLSSYSHADALVSVTITRFLLSVESCRTLLLDKNFLQLDELDDVLFNCVSYSSGNFIIGSRYTIHTIFYDYGIDVETVATVEFGCLCGMCADQDVIFVNFPDKTVIVDGQFREFTPNFLKEKRYERFHGTTTYFFFALSRDEVTVFDHGSVTSFPLKSTLSVMRNTCLYIADERDVSCHLYCHGTLLCQSTLKLNSQVTAIGVVLERSLVVAMAAGNVYLFDEEFNVTAETSLDYLIVSAAGVSSHIVLGTGTGAVLFCNKDLVVLSDIQIGIAPVSLNCVNDQISVLCGDRYHYISPSEGFKTTILPPDFEYFSPIGKGPLVFVAMVKTDKQNEHKLMTFRFTDQVQGFHSKRLYDCTGGRVAKIACSKHAGEFVAAVVDNCDLTTLFFSKGNVKHPLSRSEKVDEICEWRARLRDVKHNKDTYISFWIVSTNGDSGGRLYFFIQSRSSNEVTVKLKKEFPDHITALTIVSSSLGYFAMANSILGFSLETGALAQKGKISARSKHVVALDSGNNCVAVLYDNIRKSQMDDQKKVFSVYQVSESQTLEHAYTVSNDSILVGRMKIVGGHVLVSCRATPTVHVYSLVDGSELQIVRFLAPVTAIFDIKRKAVCCCIDGEMHAVSCDGQQMFPIDVSRMFSFGNFGFASFA